jgi:hypothetical protein
MWDKKEQLMVLKPPIFIDFPEFSPAKMIK